MTRRDDETGAVAFKVEEGGRVAALDALFGWGPIAPFAAGAAGAWLAPPPIAAWAATLTLLYGAAILAFLAGVRRGLSFRTPGGPDLAQLATMGGLFALAFGALVAPWPLACVACLIAGYAAIGVLDPIAARRLEVPPAFARLRPWQMAVPVASLWLIAGRMVWRG